MVEKGGKKGGCYAEGVIRKRVSGNEKRSSCPADETSRRAIGYENPVCSKDQWKMAD